MNNVTVSREHFSFTGTISKMLQSCRVVIDDYAKDCKDGGKELFTKMRCVLITNP